MVTKNDELLSQIRGIVEDVLNEKLTPLKDDVDDLMETYTKDLRLTYLNSVARLLEQEAHQLVDSFKCSYHPQTGTHCKTWVKDHVSMYANALELGDFPYAFSLLEEFLKISQKNVEDDDKNPSCTKDWEQIGVVLKRHYEFVKDIGSLFLKQPVPNTITDVEVHADKLYEMFVSPLSHPLRIKIISSLTHSSKRFTALKKELEVKNTGLLVHHLKPLTDAGIIAQYLKKEYYLTDFGHSVARILAQAQTTFLPSTPVRVEMRPSVTNEPERPKVVKTLPVVNDKT